MPRSTPAALGLLFSLLSVTGLMADDWPQWRGLDRMGLWRESGIVERFPEQGLTTTWRVPIRPGFAGPAVSQGRVFVLDYQETRGTRTMDGTERLLCLDEETGQILWTHEWPTTYRNLNVSFATGPRATPTVDGDRVYVLGAGGRLVSLETETGRVAWQVDTVVQYDATGPVYGMSNAPLVDDDRLIVLVGGEPDALIVAFDKTTGAEVWRALPATSETGYSQPVIIDAGGTRQLIVWHAVALTSLDPETGDVYWDQEWQVGGGMTIATPVWSGGYLLVSHFFQWLDDDGPERRPTRGAHALARAESLRAARPNRRAALDHHHAAHHRRLFLWGWELR